MSREKFSLKWNDFQSTVSGSFRALRKEEEFFDVTLVSDDEKQMSAHKLVLSACSSFFKTILRKNTHTHPLIYLSGVDSKNLGLVLNYIYEGEVNIWQEQLDNFLNLAQKLKIEGLLSQLQSDSKEDDNFKDISSFTEESLIYPEVVKEKHAKDAFKKTENVKSRNEVAKINLMVPTDTTEVDQKIEELTDRIDGVWTCKACGKTSNRKGNLGWHIETHLEGLSFPCNGCDKTFRSRNSLDTHFSRFHWILK